MQAVPPAQLRTGGTSRRAASSRLLPESTHLVGSGSSPDGRAGGCRPAGALLVVVPGRGTLRSAIHGAATDHQHVELDLSAVTFCDVVGASAIEQAQRQLEARGCQLTLQGTDGSLHRLLAVEGLFSTLQRLALLDGQQPPRPGRTSRRSTRMD